MSLEEKLLEPDPNGFSPPQSEVKVLLYTLEDLEMMSRDGVFGMVTKEEERVQDRYHLVFYLPTEARLANPRAPGSGGPVSGLVTVFSVEKLEARDDPLHAARAALYRYRQSWDDSATFLAKQGQFVGISHFHTNSLSVETLDGPVALVPGSWPVTQYVSHSCNVKLARCYNIPWRTDFIRLPAAFTDQARALHEQVHKQIAEATSAEAKAKLLKNAWAHDLHLSQTMIIRGSPSRYMQLFCYYPSNRQPLHFAIPTGDASDNDFALPNTIVADFNTKALREETLKFSTALINRVQWPDHPNPAREAWLALHKAYVDQLEKDPERPLARLPAPAFEQITFRAPRGQGSRNFLIMSPDDGTQLTEHGDSGSIVVELAEPKQSLALKNLTDLLKSAR